MTEHEHEHSFDVFGTRARVLVGPRTPGAQLDALRVQALLQKLHRTLTRFDAGSELARLNAGAGAGAAVPVSAMLREAVEAALRAARLSGGLVDPTVLEDLERCGYARSRAHGGAGPLAAALAAAPPRVPGAPRDPATWTGIAVDAAQGTVRLPRGVRIDLGGSAKGHAVDRAARLLAGHAGYAVDAGGDIRIGGAMPREVRIEDPLTGAVAHTFTVSDGAVATSGLRTRVWRTEQGFAHHLIDPARGTPAWTGVIQATALAPTALEAETLAKTALLRGPADGPALLERHGGALVLDDGRLVLSGRLDVSVPA